MSALVGSRASGIRLVLPSRLRFMLGVSLKDEKMLLLKSFFCSKPKLTLALIGLLAWQASPLSAIAQFAKGQRRAVARVDEQPPGQVEYARPKIAPDLEESIEQVATGEQQPDKKQRVIIQLRGTRGLDDTEGLESVDQQMRDEMFAGEARANEMRVPVMRAKIESLKGRFARSLNQLGLVIADLPISSVRELGDDPDVAYISPDRGVASFGHIETTVGASYYDARTEAPNLSNCNGTNVGVAILDGGVDDTHNLTKTTSSHPGLIYSKSYTGNPANRDYFGHGTFVACVLAGDISFKSGAYTGIAYDSKLISLAVLDSQGQGLSSNVVSAIDWCITYKSNYNIRVINMSLGTPPKDSYTVDPLCLAARRAHNAGMVVVAAAGNDGKDVQRRKIYGGINSPGIDPSVITVGATNSFGTDPRSDDKITTYSSRGPTRSYTTVNGVKKYDNLSKPDIVAPGNKVIGACSPSSLGQANGLVTHYPSLKCGTAAIAADQLMYLSGTSVSAPIVAGAAAMMIEANPNLTPALVKAILMYTAQPVFGANTLEQGAGRLNVEGAVRVAARVVSNCASLSNGAPMLTSTFNQDNVIAGETCVWGRGIITNYGFLYGSNLITYWQSVYAQGKVLADATPYVYGLLTRSTTLTCSGVYLYSGSITTNGTLLSDGTLLTDSTLLADGTLLSDGTLLADGTLLTDGTLLSDGTLMSDGALGDDTVCMQPVP